MVQNHAQIIRAAAQSGGRGMTTPWPVRRYLIIGAATLAVLVGGFWHMVGAGADQWRGHHQRPDRGGPQRQVVQHPFGGVVTEILVVEGDAVATGDLLIRLDPTDLQSELAIVEGQYFDILARRARLEAERDDAAALAFDPILRDAGTPAAAELMQGQERLFAARLETSLQSIHQLTQQRAQIASQIRGITAQQTALETQQGLIARELADQQSLLDRGLAQAGRVLALQREEASLQGRVGELTAQAAQAAERMTEIEIQVLGLASARREEAISRLRDLQFNQLELAERRQTLLRQLDRAGYPRAGGGGCLRDAGLCTTVRDPPCRSAAVPDPAGPAPDHRDTGSDHRY